MNEIELIAVALGLAYVVLAARGNRWCWPAGGASALLLAWVSWRARLPMQALLQLWYVVMAVHGWRRWSVPATARPGWWPLRNHVIAIGVSVVVCIPLVLWVRGQFNSAAPEFDAATTVFSLVATWLTARMRIESWLYWLAIDAVLVGLYASQGLLLTAGLFVVYLGVSIVGWRTWLKLYRNGPSTR